MRRTLHVLLAVIVLTVFLANAWHYWFLGDDGFIAFRFSKNLVDGHGLVFNVGERVEGYTQPTWVLLVAAGMWLGIGPELFAPAAGIAFGAGVLALLVYLGRARGLGFWTWVAPLALALNRSFTAWCTGGLGTQLFAFLVLASCIAFARETERGAPRALGSGLLFALATLSRPEGGMFFAVAGLFLAGDVLVRRRTAWRHLFVWPLPVVILVGAHFLWRHDYYGYWLPNTFYAKVSGWWWEQARHYIRLFIEDHALYLALPLLAGLAAMKMARVHTLFLAACGMNLLYIVYIGGDRFEWRFWTPILPMLWWLFGEASRGLATELVKKRGLAIPIGVVAVGITLYSAALPRFVPPPDQPREHIAPIQAIAGYAAGRTEQGKFLKQLVDEGYLDGDELIAVRGAGALPYYSEFPILDLHGLNDTEIAHAQIESRGMVAHEKEATLEYVTRRGVVMCNVHNTLVFESRPSHLLMTGVELADYVPRPVRLVEVKGKFIAFGTTLSEAEYREKFAKFHVLR